MPPAQAPDLLRGLLKNVSRSFYLTLRVLPRPLRTPVGLAYLLARAADTIADTKLIPPAERLELLLSFQAQVKGPCDSAQLRKIESALCAQQENPHERLLLQSLPPAFELLEQINAHDGGQVRRVVVTLTQGMEWDLRTFPLESSGQVLALQTPAELDRYTYLVAGCVGEFWTNETVTHTPALHAWDVMGMSACGVRFGKALQMTNVLRDCARDLRIGRCYLPNELLQAHGLRPQDLLSPANSQRARPILSELLGVTLGHYHEAQRYLLEIPGHCRRLRLACLWPIVIGLTTLKKLAQQELWLDPAKPAIVSRAYVYKVLALSVPLVGSDRAVRRWTSRLAGAVDDARRGPVR